MNIFNGDSSSGLVLSNVFSISGAMMSLALTGSQIFGKMSSVERVNEFIQIKDMDEEKGGKNQEFWLNSGNIEFINVNVRYRENTPLVLKNINLEIKNGEKVGIVGRSGSGKSTILLTLMRILEIEKENNSCIMISNFIISKLSLHNLRKSISIIPQNPYIIKGTLRKNIDPLGNHTDREIIEILREIEFTEISSSSKENGDNFLNEKIEKNGSNLSVGQKQLICIARALIKNPKILLMDEATANIDEKTDEILQKLIKGVLKDSTILTIAHRIETIIHYDKIVVMDDGRIVEIGKPKDLLRVEGGKFEKIVSENGAEFKERMLNMLS